MHVQLISGSPTHVLCDMLIVGLFEGIMSLEGASEAADEALNGQISSLVRDMPDCGQFGKTTILHTFSGLGCKRLLILGLGKKEDLTVDKLRHLSAVAIRAAQQVRAKIVASMVYGADAGGQPVDKAAQALVEGAILGNYHFLYYKTDKKEFSAVEELLIVEQDEGRSVLIKDAVDRGQIIAEAVNLARDLVNHPACYMTPTKMVWHATEIARNGGLELIVLDREQMREQNMHALLAVAQGSYEPPKMIVLKYTGDPHSKDVLGFIGKGITFDSGGISLKPSEGMQEMKDDMAGGAAVLGAMAAIARLKPKVNIIGVVPCTENMPSGKALKPGDVISSLEGKTIEIVSTDAEGRLILADAVAYARKLGATHLIDIATLTGACVVALGSNASGVISNNREWCRQVIDAAEEAGEKLWELPNFVEYQEQIKSHIADLKNSGGRQAGAITAGLFIGHFVGQCPWVHIDIAGTASIDKERGYNVKGGTGVGVRTLVQVALKQAGQN
ncbi:leucyl aminopeptidase [Sporolituus thermophilus]|uniref:Probable cytosol aminopeptidase n=1 Tax=Sporolituus thermophilus DSM 23256 TaxID=1123285 RepID=A0A1G7NS61_9FIRM|nr:leucyl aminopeptidase [Sporolituus thermophilus]SDF76090.1 leucyl aminopeptidase [Sporolituus thermophilus DSM 23256]